jgi:hypothetical protein
MNKRLRAFIKSLNPEELSVLKNHFQDKKKVTIQDLVNQDSNFSIQLFPAKKKKMTIKELINQNPKMSIRLFTSLELYAKKYPLVTDIAEHRFLTIKNTGKRTWNELSELLRTKYKINGN